MRGGHFYSHNFTKRSAKKHFVRCNSGSVVNHVSVRGYSGRVVNHVSVRGYSGPVVNHVPLAHGAYVLPLGYRYCGMNHFQSVYLISLNNASVCCPASKVVYITQALLFRYISQSPIYQIIIDASIFKI